MKILSFDVSTKFTGAVIYNQNDRSHIKKLFVSTKKIVYERISEIAADIFEWINDKEFDIVLVTKGYAGAMNPSILQLEGLLLSIAVTKKIKFDYYPDISWYSFIGSPNDNRRKKKIKSVQEYCKNNFKPHQVKKLIEVKDAKGRLNKIKIIMQNGEIITDDIADAWNAARLFQKRIVREEIKHKKLQIQFEIKKIRSEMTKKRKKIKLLKSDLNVVLTERNNFKKEWKVSGDKRKYNSFVVRCDREIAIDRQIQELDESIKSLNSQYQFLLQKKNANY